MYLFLNQKSLKLRDLITNRLVPQRLWIIGLLSLIFIALEILEERVPLDRNRFCLEIISVILFLVLLALIWILLELLLNTINTKNHALDILQIKHSLSEQLTIATEWEDIIDTLLKFPQSITPLIGASLLIYDPQSARFQTVTKQMPGEKNSQPAYSFRIPEKCFTSLHEFPTTIHAIELSPPVDGTLKPGTPNGYCLPFFGANSLIAKLLLFLPQEHTLSPIQSDIFNHVAPEMAVALAAAQQRHEQTTILIDKAQDQERLSISRDLHDTLGQNLVYLHLKLDHFSRDIEKVDLLEMRTELEQMREVANKSYELVYGTLAILHAEEAIPLINLLLDHSRLVVDRSKFKVRITQSGPPRKLKPALLRQIFYIFGEALSNVERHANAQKVTVKLAWGQNDLLIKITDNGRGFDPKTAQNEQHFGLKIMQERTATLGGRFDLQSTSHGTQVTVWFPLVFNDL